MADEGQGGERTRMELLGAGRAAEVFAWEPGIVVKLVREARFEPALWREAAGLEAAAAAGIAVPKPMGFVTLEGRLGLLLERIDGDDVFSLIEAQPWRVWTLARLVGTLHVQLATAAAPDSVESLRERATRVIEESLQVPAGARSRLMAILEAASDGDRLCHMDFHPGNVMLTRDEAYIIDFPNALRGPAIADHARSWVILKGGKPTPAMGRSTRVLVATLRRVALAGYTRGYRSACDVDDRDLARWKAIQVAMRLEEGIPDERTPLLRLLSRTLREAERSES